MNFLNRDVDFVQKDTFLDMRACAQSAMIRGGWMIADAGRGLPFTRSLLSFDPGCPSLHRAAQPKVLFQSALHPSQAQPAHPGHGKSMQNLPKAQIPLRIEYVVPKAGWLAVSQLSKKSDICAGASNSQSSRLLGERHLTGGVGKRRILMQ